MKSSAASSASVRVSGGHTRRFASASVARLCMRPSVSSEPSERENLCPNARYTGYQIDGGYAEQASPTPVSAFTFPPLRRRARRAAACAGLIGYRAYDDGRCEAARHLWDSAPRHTSLRRWRCTRIARSWPFVTPGDSTPRISRERLERAGRLVDGRPRRRSTRQSSLRPIGACSRSALAHAAGRHRRVRRIHMSDIPSFPRTSCYGKSVLSDP
jgi:propanol-preferring alcohol dehydrogenase